MFLVSESSHEYILAFKVLLSCVIQNIICSPFWKKRQMCIKFREQMILLILLREDGTSTDTGPSAEKGGLQMAWN